MLPFLLSREGDHKEEGMYAWLLGICILLGTHDAGLLDDGGSGIPPSVMDDGGSGIPPRR